MLLFAMGIKIDKKQQENEQQTILIKNIALFFNVIKNDMEGIKISILW